MTSFVLARVAKMVATISASRALAEKSVAQNIHFECGFMDGKEFQGAIQPGLGQDRRIA